MIKVSVLYPNKEGVRFDIDYYCNTHIPMVQEKLGTALKDVAVDYGRSGPEFGSPAPFIAMAHLVFDSAEAFQKSFSPHAETIMGDIPNFTNAQPSIQISEVKI